MRIILPPTRKFQWMDRNPSFVRVGYETFGLGPHVDTLRSSYTIQAAKRGVLLSYNLAIMRFTAAAPVDRVKLSIILNINTVDNMVAFLPLLNNTVGASAIETADPAIFLNAGDIVKLYSQDSGTGGTVDYHGNIVIAEFDP